MSRCNSIRNRSLIISQTMSVLNRSAIQRPRRRAISDNRTPIVWLMLIFLLLLSGCNRLSTEYGQSAGYLASQSLNGFAALRQSYINAGADDRDVRRLTDRVTRCDAIVWTPTYTTAIGSDVTDWFDTWLRRGGRTLVYVIPDSGSEADYWTRAIDVAPPEQRLEYRRRAARSINERMQWRMNRTAIPSNGWFEMEPTVERREFNKFRGRWASDLKSVAKGNAVTPRPLKSEYSVEPYRPPANSAQQTPATGTTNPGNAPSTGPTGPGSPNWSFSAATVPTRTEVSFMPVLMDDSGKTIVARITSDKWGDSQMIIVGGGSLLTNYAFTDQVSVDLADKIVRESLRADSAKPRVGFTSTTPAFLPVSKSEPGVPKATGMELLTVWPVSLITIHAVLLGIVACLMLIPSLGRPRRIRYHSKSHFGDHLDAVASLMSRAKGEAFARSRISDYFRRVHGETTGEWIEPEPAPKE